MNKQAAEILADFRSAPWPLRILAVVLICALFAACGGLVHYLNQLP